MKKATIAAIAALCLLLLITAAVSCTEKGGKTPEISPAATVRTGGSSEESSKEASEKSEAKNSEETGEAQPYVVTEKGIVYMKCTIGKVEGWQVKADVQLFGELILPGELLGKPVMRVASDAFKDQKAVTKIVLPDSVVQIGGGAFSGCKSLRELRLSPGVKKLTYRTVFECDALERLDLPEGLEELQQDAVVLCASLSAVSLPSTLKKMENNFAGCPVREYYISDLAAYCAISGRRDVYEGCRLFLDGEEVVDLVLPEAQYIRMEGAFAGFGIRSVSFPAGLKSIADNAFALTELESIALPEGLKQIGRYAFAYTKIAEVSFPSTLGYIGSGAFDRCPLAEVAFPPSLRTISDGAFAGTLLTEVYLPEGVQTVARNAFDTETLKVISLPASLEKFWPYEVAPALEKMIYRGSEKQLKEVSKKLRGDDGNDYDLISLENMPEYFVFESQEED